MMVTATGPLMALDRAEAECAVEFMAPPAQYRAELLTGDARASAWASGWVRGNPDLAPVVVISPMLPIPIELSRPGVEGISTLSIRGARWRRNR